MAYGDLKVRNLIWNTGSGDNTLPASGIAPTNNPTLTGTVTIPTAPASDVSTKAASTAFVDAYYATKAAPAFTGSATGVNLTLSGNLTVNGTTTTINTQTLDVEDKDITLGKVSTPSDTTADNGGIVLKGASDKYIKWSNNTDAWTSSEHIHLPDNKKLLVGGTLGSNGSHSLSLFHDTSNNYLISDGGDLYVDTSAGHAFRIKTDQFIIKNAANNETLLSADNGSAVTLYYDNSKKFETQTNGITVTGLISATGNLLLNAADNQKLYLGASNDLQIYHDGTSSFVYDTTSNLYLRSLGDIFIQPKGGENGIVVKDDGAVELYYDNGKKFETTSAGVEVAGDMSLNGAIVENVFAITDAASVALDPANGTIQTWTLGANRAATDSLATGESLLLMITAGAHSLTWPTMTWNGGSAPTLSSSAKTAVEIWKAGSTLYGATVGDL
mgnify:CR=1 FL=1|tara:strand:+ start:33 stop:1361 length:1329 start_codon:yes stop_codon:yes gene_type:complete